ncbi:hypothetical protein GCM10008915_36660 [Bifidobacterium pullorum subsp. gallinarum]
MKTIVADPRKKYVVSPYTYGPFNNPASWGIWNAELGSWTAHTPSPRKKDAEEVAKALNKA